MAVKTAKVAVQETEAKAQKPVQWPVAPKKAVAVKETEPKKAVVSKAKADKAPSTKLLVYQDYKAKATIEALIKKYGKKVKESSIRSWVGSWRHGRYFPRGAK